MLSPSQYSQITAQLDKEILTFQTEIGFYQKPKSFSLQGTTESKAGLVKVTIILN